MARLTSLTASEKKFLDDALYAAEQAAGKKLTRQNRHIVLDRARAQIEAQRHAAKMQAEREAARQEGVFTWSKPKPFRR